MSDSDQCTLDPHPDPSLFDETRTHLRELTDLLRQVEERLETFGRRLPKPGTEFDPVAELRNGMECVRQDLLGDALETLHLIATLPEDELRKRFEERHKWLAQPHRRRTPHGRLLHRGAQSLTDAELLSILLRTDKGTAHELLEEIGFYKLVGIDSRTLRGCLTKARTTTLLAAVEFACRLARSKIPEQVLLSRPATIAQYIRLRYEQGGQEVMGALYLDMRNRLVHEAELFRGTLSSATVEPRAILRKGLACNAARLILFHTHPSGDPAPSAEDIGFTKRLVEACHVVGIGLRDHIILGANKWVSLRQMGEL